MDMQEFRKYNIRILLNLHHLSHSAVQIPLLFGILQIYRHSRC
jgi:hypothetical protein